MTVLGWLQILLFCSIVVALAPLLGGYMTRVFNGERTFLSWVLQPVEGLLYRIAGVDPKREQHWLTYTVAILLFNAGGFLVLYGVMRLQALLPFNPSGQSAVAPISRSTPPSVSSPTPTGRTTAAKARCPTSCRCWV